MSQVSANCQKVPELVREENINSVEVNFSETSPLGDDTSKWEPCASSSKVRLREEGELQGGALQLPLGEAITINIFVRKDYE